MDGHPGALGRWTESRLQAGSPSTTPLTRGNVPAGKLFVADLSHTDVTNHAGAALIHISSPCLAAPLEPPELPQDRRNRPTRTGCEVGAISPPSMTRCG